MDEFMLFPLTELDGISDDDDADDADDADDENEAGDARKNGASNGTAAPPPKGARAFRPLMTLKQRRRSKLGGTVINNLNLRWEDGFPQPAATASPPSSAELTSPRDNWRRALRLVRQLTDPWAQYGIEQRAAEVCTRHRYHALKRKWVVDRVTVKMEDEVRGGVKGGREWRRFYVVFSITKFCLR